MPTSVSVVETSVSFAPQRAAVSRSAARGPETMTPLAVRVRGEYLEMPGLRLTLRQAARLFGIPIDVAAAVLDELRRASILACSDAGDYSLIG